MRAVSIQFSDKYLKQLDKLKEEMQGFNPLNRVISQPMVLRYALRIGNGEPRNEKTVSEVFAEDSRGRSPAEGGQRRRPKK